MENDRNKEKERDGGLDENSEFELVDADPVDNKPDMPENDPGEGDGGSKGAAKARVVRLPKVRELPYLILPCLSSIAIILSLKNGFPTDADGRTNFFISAALTLAMFVFMFVHFKVPKQFAILPVGLAPACAMLLLENMDHDPFSIGGHIIFLNCLFFYLVAAILLCLTRRTSIAVCVPCVYALLAGLAEHYVLLFRSAPLFPWDFASIGIAASVVGNYEFVVTPSLALTVTLILFVIYVGFYVSAKLDSLKNITVRIASTVAALLLFFGYGLYINTERVFDDFGLYPYLFTPTTLYYRNGFTVSFMTNMRYLSIDKPEGYSPDALEAIGDEIDDIEVETGKYSDVTHPNIIAIMDEAFSDLSVLCDFETNEDYMPFIRSLTEDTVRGKLHMSVLGGNTANSEFEFLTGLSMAYLPTGSIPYQQYIKSERPSLASQLKANGYTTLAIHPYGASGWNRNTVYPNLGFEEMRFRNNLYGMTAIRDYISDISVFRFILSELQYRETDQPFFAFNVTMQNHGAYTKQYDNFNDRAITAVGRENDQQLSQYLSLIKRTDEAVEMLITRLKSFDEPTIVVFFGDHQPGDWVSAALLRQKGVSIDQTDVTEREKYYTVPFFIWANYDIKEEEIPAMSANYLSTLLCEVVNIELTDTQKFLSEMRKSYPVISANTFMDADGVYHPLSEVYGEEWLRKYAMLQYNYLFDNNTTGYFE